MLKLLKSIAIFALKILVLAYLFVLLEEVLNKFIFWVSDKIHGRDPLDRENAKMEAYYKKHGVHCFSCNKYFPITFDECPLCGEKMSLLKTTNERLRITQANE